jgi:hypothetical protein
MLSYVPNAGNPGDLFGPVSGREPRLTHFCSEIQQLQVMPMRGHTASKLVANLALAENEQRFELRRRQVELFQQQHQGRSRLPRPSSRAADKARSPKGLRPKLQYPHLDLAGLVCSLRSLAWVERRGAPQCARSYGRGPSWVQPPPVSAFKSPALLNCHPKSSLRHQINDARC